ncbi:hypothetical protein HNQ43_000017 [Faecalicoccus acidiformans]|uniref:DUF5105 domain-containing protein n=1 Tax=Faecalicoccus acidiformans TaxID=915173 RepID=A0A7W8FVV1_9FIRM|nr:hypothetical protein [Faecalicoccus acidiformans]MBB5183984.1 hypothetical protein [Faecalicoccus acidiformans]
MKNKIIGLLMVLVLAGCATSSNTAVGISSGTSIEDIQTKFEESTYSALSELITNTVETYEYQVCVNTELSGTYILPSAEYNSTGGIGEVDLTPKNWDGMQDTKDCWLEDGTAYSYSEDSSSLYMSVDDGSLSKGYQMNGQKDYNDPNKITVSSFYNTYEEYLENSENDPVTDPDEMEQNAKNTVIGNVSSEVNTYLYVNGNYEDLIDFKVTVQETEKGQDAIVLEPKDMDEFNKLYMEDDTFGSPLDVYGVEDLKIDSLTYDLYQIILVLDDNNCINQVIKHSKQTAAYQDKTTSSDEMITNTFSKMKKDEINTDLVKSFFTMYENGEIGEGDTFQIDE